MSDLRVMYQNATRDDPQAKAETDEFSMGPPGEVLVLIYVRYADGTIGLEHEQRYSQSDLSTHSDDLRLAGASVRSAITAANES